MIALLAKLGIGSIASKIADAYVAQQNAKTDHERIAAAERMSALKAQRDVLIAEGRSNINAIVRALFALPVAIYFAKLYLWDKVLGLGTTDGLSPDLMNVAMIVIGFYFVADTTTTVTRIIKRR